jgi:hypothetical protein
MPVGVFGNHATDAVEPPATFPQLNVGDTCELGQHDGFFALRDSFGVLAPYRHRHSAGIALENDPSRRFRIPLRTLFQVA